MQNPLTFLLIDDDEDDRELFLLALEDLDIESRCVTAGSCMEALDLLNADTVRPDYIFLDLNMPLMNGRECLAELKQNIRLSGIPVIIFSTSSEPADIAVTRELGAVGFITKPSKITELTKVLSNFFQQELHKK